MLTIGEVMTSTTVGIQAGETFNEAWSLMRRNRIRHLPVFEDERLVGVLSERDLHVATTVAEVDPDLETVSAAMAETPFTVAPDAPVGEVAREMSARRLGSAVVVDGGKVVGVFTTTDALALLAKLA